MSDKDDKKDNKDEKPAVELTREEKLKEKMRKLKKNDPFIYR